MSKFKREERYIVLKIKDIDRYLSKHQKDMLKDICQEINGTRVLVKGKSILKCVVVENDWPEYETVWKMIEDRHNNQCNTVPQDNK